MHIRVFVPKSHGIITPFFFKILSMISQITFVSTDLSVKVVAIQRLPSLPFLNS